jgi:hypothetical protein
LRGLQRLKEDDMLEDNESTRLLQEIRDLLAEQSQMSKDQMAAAKERLDSLSKQRVVSEGKFIKRVNQNAIYLSIWIAIVASLAVLSIVNWK